MKTDHKIIAGITLLTLVIIVGGTWLSSKASAANQARINIPLMGDKIADLGGEHVARGQSHIAYNSNPPTSGHIGLT